MYKIHPLNQTNTPKELMGNAPEKIGDVFFNYPGHPTKDDPLGQRGWAGYPEGFDLKTLWDHHPAL